MIHYLLKLNTFVEILELLPQIRSTSVPNRYFANPWCARVCVFVISRDVVIIGSFPNYFMYCNTARYWTWQP